MSKWGPGRVVLAEHMWWAGAFSEFAQRGPQFARKGGHGMAHAVAAKAGHSGPNADRSRLLKIGPKQGGGHWPQQARHGCGPCSSNYTRTAIAGQSTPKASFAHDHGS